MQRGVYGRESGRERVCLVALLNGIPGCTIVAEYSEETEGFDSGYRFSVAEIASLFLLTGTLIRVGNSA